MHARYTYIYICTLVYYHLQIRFLYSELGSKDVNSIVGVDFRTKQETHTYNTPVPSQPSQPVPGAVPELANLLSWQVRLASYRSNGLPLSY